KVVPRQCQSELADRAPRLPGRAEPCRRPAGIARPVRAARLLLRGSRLAARRPCLQPHRVAARHVGEDRAARRRDTEMSGLTAFLCISLAGAASPSSLVHVGKLDVLHFKSRLLGTERTIRVWLPPGFSRHTRYSVFYLND